MTPTERNVTRGQGRLEGFLARRRAVKANALVPATLKKGRVLDIGCGSFPFFLTRTEFSERYGLDKGIDEGLIKELRKDHEIMLVAFDIGYSHRLPFGNSYFDVVTMLAVLEHIEPQRVPQIIPEIRRILKPGGMFIMTTPAPWTEGLLKLLARMDMVSAEEISEHKCSYSRKQIHNVLRQGGFHESSIKSGYFELFMNIWARAQKD